MINGFISYSHEDKIACDELCNRLHRFKKEGIASFWGDHSIEAGVNWKKTFYKP